MSEVHPSKAAVPIDSTPSGIVTEASEAHPWKARSPIVLVLEGIATALIRRQLRNANAPMWLTPSGITSVSPAALVPPFPGAGYRPDPDPVPPELPGSSSASGLVPGGLRSSTVTAPTAVIVSAAAQRMCRVLGWY